MKIFFTRLAKRDLDKLRAYLGPLSPIGLANVTGVLEARILSLADNPSIGRQTPHNRVREIVEPRYGFLVPYCQQDDVIWILRIYRANRRPLDYDKLKLP